ncbi:GAF and ANTAR domain-containing protein [Kribbella sp. NPDC054772]
MSGANTALEGPAETFGRLALDLESVEGLEATAETIGRYAVQVLDLCEHAGISVVAPDGGIEVAHATDPIVAYVLNWQLEVGDGPMLHAVTSAVAVHVADPATDTRWPLWSRLVAEHPINAMLHVPLATGPFPIGALSLYHDKPHAFGHEDEEIAHILASHASIAIADVRHKAYLIQAMDTRKLVGQAIGILMERNDLTSDQASDVMRRYAQDAHLEPSATAQKIIATRRSA